MVPHIQKFFAASLGDGALFRFWLDEWSDKGCLRGRFPRLFALTLTRKVKSKNVGTEDGTRHWRRIYRSRGWGSL